MPLSSAALIKDIGSLADGFRDLAENEARALFVAMLAGGVSPPELRAIVLAFRVKGESLVEMIGFMRALDAHIGRLEAAVDRPRPVVLPSYDGTCRQPNLTALLALLLKRYGVPVLVHGPSAELGSDSTFCGKVESDRNSDPNSESDPNSDSRNFPFPVRVTTGEVLWELGIEPASSLADAQARLLHDNIAYLPTGVLAPGLPQLLACRPLPGVPSSAHSLAKLIDPFGGDGYRVVSVAHPNHLARIREFLAVTRANALLLHGTEGEPFANPCRQPLLEHFAAGAGTVCNEADPEMPTDMPQLPATRDAATTAAWIAQALSGEQPLPPPIVAQLGCCLIGARRQAPAAENPRDSHLDPYVDP